LFFRPLVRRFREAGHDVWVTVRRYGETVAIAEACNFDLEVVGEHGGRSTVGKGLAIARRAVLLAARVRRRRPALAVSFNSYAQALAARACGVPFVTLADYEYQPANHLAFRLARTVIVPEGFDVVALRRQGAGGERVVFFQGLKESVSLVDFVPNPRFPSTLAALGIPDDDAVVVMRPPATSTAYHRFGNDFFYEVLAHIAALPNVTVVLLPRYPSQGERVRSLGLQNVVIPPGVVDGLNLVYWSDVVVSAGGSMNREAVVLGTPAYTVFGGRMAGVDTALLASGRMTELRSATDLEGLVIKKRRRNRFRPVPDSATHHVVAAILGSAAHF
jgi:predicted glycosyltransferase